MRVVDLRLELTDVTPPVWRALRLPSDLRLDDLHHAIQAVMGWEDFHPHVFEIADRDYGPRAEEVDEDDAEEVREPDAWAGDDRDITVAAAFALAPEGFTYVYDFTEDWRVRVTRAGFADGDGDGDAVVVCTAGEHVGPQVESRDLEPFTVDAANRRLRRALRPRATPEAPAGPGASTDQQLLAHLSLVVLLLGSRPTRRGRREAWKNVRTEILDSLADAGLIETDPQRKSVTLTDAGVAHAERLLKRLRSL